MIYFPTSEFSGGDEDSWATIFAELVAYSVDYDRDAPKPWMTYSDPGGFAEHAAAHYRRLEAPHELEIERCVRDLIANGSCNVESDQGKYFLGFRIDVVLSFVSLAATKDRFVPFPVRTRKEVLSWLLIDWWKEHGAIAAYTFGHIV